MGEIIVKWWYFMLGFNVRREPNLYLGEYISLSYSKYLFILSKIVVGEVGKLCSYLYFLLLNHPDYFNHIWSKFTIGDHCQIQGSNISLEMSTIITSRTPRRKSSISLELTCTFNYYSTSIWWQFPLRNNINYWWMDKGRRYWGLDRGWRSLVRNNLFTNIGQSCFWKSSSNSGLQLGFLGN